MALTCARGRKPSNRVGIGGRRQHNASKLEDLPREERDGKEMPSPKNVVDADDALWLAAGAVFVDESRLGQHPDVAAMLSQKAVLPCLTLALGEHWKRQNSQSVNGFRGLLQHIHNSDKAK